MHFHNKKKTPTADQFRFKTKSVKKTLSKTKLFGSLTKKLQKFSSKLGDIFEAASKAFAIDTNGFQEALQFLALFFSFISKHLKIALDHTKPFFKIIKFFSDILKLHTMRLKLQAKWAKTESTETDIKDLPSAVSLGIKAYQFFLKTLKISLAIGALVVAFPSMMEVFKITISMAPQIANLFELAAAPLSLLSTGLGFVIAQVFLMKTSFKLYRLRSAKSALNELLTKESGQTLKDWTNFLRGAHNDLTHTYFRTSHRRGFVGGEELKDFFVLRQQYLLLKKELAKNKIDIRSLLTSESVFGHETKNLSAQDLIEFKKLYDEYRAQKEDYKEKIGPKSLKTLINSVEQREPLLKGKAVERGLDLLFNGLCLLLLTVASSFNPVTIAVITTAIITWNVLKKWKKLPRTSGPFFKFQKWGTHPLPITEKAKQQNHLEAFMRREFEEDNQMQSIFPYNDSYTQTINATHGNPTRQEEMETSNYAPIFAYKKMPIREENKWSPNIPFFENNDREDIERNGSERKNYDPMPATSA